ncbi:MAG: hypothetical protein AAF570_07570, partial [Bacteroidota bacterium]
VDLLGPAEQTKLVGKIRQISYYFDGACENGKLAEGTVYCLARFFIVAETGVMEGGGVVCG